MERSVTIILIPYKSITKQVNNPCNLKTEAYILEYLPTHIGSFWTQGWWAYGLAYKTTHRFL